ncbi:MAG: glycosyltransferase family 4 protein [Alphaproteobacteria bacterium]|jgi:glycosyltransferase involved in cell wall biosynthesis|nr:glycosyltransferase family 4 protein [Alphaproteobacteria bacterium]
MKICFILATYQSHRRAGLDYRRALAAAGATLVEEPDNADVVVIHDEPQTLLGYYRVYPGLRHHRVIAYTVWEPSCLNDDRRRWLGLVDEIWTASTFCRDIHAGLGKPVTVIPHIVAPATVDEAADARLRASLGLTEGDFLFYTISRQEERKNLEASLRAFHAAFPDGPARYIVKTPLPLPPALAGLPGVVNVTARLDDDEIAALHRIGHCYVSAHCAEGWGLPLSDAMAHGRLVIATGYGGNMDFMDEGNSMPVRYRLEPIRRPETRVRFGFAPDSTEARWAYVDEDHLAARMGGAFADWAVRGPMRDAARQAMTRYDEDTIGRRMVDRLRTITGI